MAEPQINRLFRLTAMETSKLITGPLCGTRWIPLTKGQRRGKRFHVKRSWALTMPKAHYGDVVMGTVASQITSLTIVYSTVYSGADQRKHQSSASLAFVPGIHRGPVNSPHKWPVTRKMFPFDDVIMLCTRGLTLIKGNNHMCVVIFIMSRERDIVTKPIAECRPYDVFVQHVIKIKLQTWWRSDKNQIQVQVPIQNAIIMKYNNKLNTKYDTEMIFLQYIINTHMSLFCL